MNEQQVLKKVLFIDRDGTLIVEPPITKQVNSLDELMLIPYTISSLKSFVHKGYKLAMITNQDGLGSEANPMENFNIINNKLFEILSSEGIYFEEVLYCEHYLEDNCDCRKPKVGMVKEYFQNNHIDKENSYVIGDRDTDLEFADALGIKGYKISGENSWENITKEILNPDRVARVHRVTNETDILVDLNLDGTGKYNIDTGLNFLNHMLEQLSKHSSFDLTINCKGDLHVDEHHTIEDIAIVLGKTLKKSLGNKIGIERYASSSVVVMDESISNIAIDISGRPFLVFEASFNNNCCKEYVGDFPTEMMEHFLISFCHNAGINMHLKLKGSNSHHKVEAAFKSLAKALKCAVVVNNDEVSSTKGVL